MRQTSSIPKRSARSGARGATGNFLDRSYAELPGTRPCCAIGRTFDQAAEQAWNKACIESRKKRRRFFIQRQMRGPTSLPASKISGSRSKATLKSASALPARSTMPNRCGNFCIVLESPLLKASRRVELMRKQRCPGRETARRPPTNETRWTPAAGFLRCPTKRAKDPIGTSA